MRGSMWKEEENQMLIVDLIKKKAIPIYNAGF